MSGEVAISPDAVIAPGVVLMADPQSKIVVGAGVCLGLGVVLHAHQGSIVIEASASLGAGVLVVGNCRIGTQACVGASTTLHNASVPPSQLVPPGSLLGQSGRSSSGFGDCHGSGGGEGASGSPASSGFQASREARKGQGNATAATEPSPWDDGFGGYATSAASSASETPASSSSSKTPKIEDESRDTADRSGHQFGSSTNASPKRPTKIYGKEQFERMRTLFMPDQTV